MTDTARLDWLIKQGPPGAAEGMGLNDEVWDVAVGFVKGPRKGSDKRSVRAAIDAAMESNQTTK